MFSIQYAYLSIWAWVAGSLIWARFSSKIPNAAPYPREVKHPRTTRTARNTEILFNYSTFWCPSVSVFHRHIPISNNTVPRSRVLYNHHKAPPSPSAAKRVGAVERAYCSLILQIFTGELWHKSRGVNPGVLAKIPNWPSYCTIMAT
jgi:hypothetical protein